MTEPALTEQQLEHFDAVLRRRRDEAEEHLARLNASMTEVQTARSDGAADDEHDPEGPTMSDEWSRLSGLVSTAQNDLAVVDRAVTRLENGTYGRCVRCGEPIAMDRLEARPAAELCIGCARLVG
jgi:RNA polymerase-binding protein DksA